MTDREWYADPSDAARALLHALDARRWQDVASFVSRRAAEAFRYQAIEAAISIELDELEWLEARRTAWTGGAYRRPEPVWSFTWYGVDSMAELRALSGRDMIARSLECDDLRDRLPNEDDVLVRVERTLIGCVQETDRVVHAVFRETEIRSHDTFSMVDLICLKRTRSGWGNVSLRSVMAHWFVFPPRNLGEDE
jgi:hypothetical protein